MCTLECYQDLCKQLDEKKASTQLQFLKEIGPQLTNSHFSTVIQIRLDKHYSHSLQKRILAQLGYRPVSSDFGKYRNPESYLKGTYQIKRIR